MQGRGCDRCGGTGYKGRVGLFEVMEMTEALRELVVAERAGRPSCAKLAIDGRHGARCVRAACARCAKA